MERSIIPLPFSSSSRESYRHNRCILLFVFIRWWLMLEGGWLWKSFKTQRRRRNLRICKWLVPRASENKMLRKKVLNNFAIKHWYNFGLFRSRFSSPLLLLSQWKIKNVLGEIWRWQCFFHSERCFVFYFPVLSLLLLPFLSALRWSILATILCYFWNSSSICWLLLLFLLLFSLPLSSGTVCIQGFPLFTIALIKIAMTQPACKI